MREEDGKEVIFDEFRKLWVRLTPEEWVRQNLLHYLVKEKKYPSSLIAVETEIKLNDLKKRCDIVVYQQGRPWMIIECKEMNVVLNEAVLSQVLRYNIPLDVAFIAISNGSETYLWKLDNGNAIQQASFPLYG